MKPSHWRGSNQGSQCMFYQKILNQHRLNLKYQFTWIAENCLSLAILIQFDNISEKKKKKKKIQRDNLGQTVSSFLMVYVEKSMFCFVLPPFLIPKWVYETKYGHTIPPREILPLHIHSFHFRVNWFIFFIQVPVHKEYAVTQPCSNWKNPEVRDKSPMASSCVECFSNFFIFWSSFFYYHLEHRNFLIGRRGIASTSLYQT